MSDKIEKLIKWSNKNSGFITLVGLIITVLTLVLWNKYIGTLFLLSLITGWIWYFFNEHLKNNNKIIIGTVTTVSLILLAWIWVYNFFYSSSKIFDLTKWFELKFEDKFIWWNLAENKNFPWKNKDNEITNAIDGGITLKTSAALGQKYPIFQNLKNIQRDYILASKFYLPDGARVGTQFMNTQWTDSDKYLGYHFQECVLTTFKGDFNGDYYNKGYGDYLYERKPAGWAFNKQEMTPWNYFMLVSVSWTSFSCYIQKEWEKNYTTVVKDKELKYFNLWWPALSQMVDGVSFAPKVLNFKLYIRK